MEKWISENEALSLLGVEPTKEAKHRLLWLGYKKKVRYRRMLGNLQYEEGAVIKYEASKNKK